MIATALVSTAACGEPSTPSTPRREQAAVLEPEAPPVERYTWLAAYPELPPSVSLETRFPTPAGAARVSVKGESFAAWLRGLPVRLDRRTVEDYRGRALPFSEHWAAGVIVLDVGTKNLQQCADTILRLHAEWLWSVERDHAALAYHFTSGDESRWQDWAAGRRLVVDDDGVHMAQPGTYPRVSPDRQALGEWLEQIFMYAGTASLAHDSEAVPLDEPLQPGDFIVRPGSPGHAVIILDVAEPARGDEQLVLVGQGSMPAQELHVLAGDRDASVDGVWFRLPVYAEGAIPVPGWGELPRSQARRMLPAQIGRG